MLPPTYLLNLKKIELEIAKQEFRRFPHLYQESKVSKAQEEVDKILNSISPARIGQ
jgi:hypothetical protein